MIPTRQCRVIVYNRFYKLLQEYNKNTTNLDIICINLEKAIYNYTLRKINKTTYWTMIFNNLYIDKAVSMYNILDPKSYIYKDVDRNLKTSWIYDIIDEVVTPHQFCYYTYMKLQPCLYLNVKQNINECMRNVIEVDHDSLIQCIRCKKFKTIYKEQALRAADETVDIMVRCTLCNYIWKLDC